MSVPSSKIFDYLHKFLHPVLIHLVFKFTVIFKGRCNHCSVGYAEKAFNCLLPAARIGRTTVSGTSAFTSRSVDISVGEVSRQARYAECVRTAVETVDFAICLISLSARYLAASGTILNKAWHSRSYLPLMPYHLPQQVFQSPNRLRILR